MKLRVSLSRVLMDTSIGTIARGTGDPQVDGSDPRAPSGA